MSGRYAGCLYPSIGHTHFCFYILTCVEEGLLHYHRVTCSDYLNFSWDLRRSVFKRFQNCDKNVIYIEHLNMLREKVWSVSWMVSRFVGWMVSRFVGWMVSLLAGWSVGLLVGWLVGLL